MQRLVICQLCVILLQNLNWIFCFSFFLVSLLWRYDIFYLFRQSMDNDVEEELRWLRQREWDIGEDVECRWFFLAGQALECWLHLAIEHKEDEWPVSSKIIRPLLKRQLRQCSIFAIWVFDPGLFLSQVGFFMKAINQEVEILLWILLIISTELFIYLSKCMLESFWNHNLLGVPHLLYQTCKRHHQITSVTHFVINVKLLQIDLILYIVLMQQLDIDQTL